LLLARAVPAPSKPFKPFQSDSKEFKHKFRAPVPTAP
jgi:hypothetical protein